MGGSFSAGPHTPPDRRYPGVRPEFLVLQMARLLAQATSSRVPLIVLRLASATGTLALPPTRCRFTTHNNETRPQSWHIEKSTTVHDILSQSEIDSLFSGQDDYDPVPASVDIASGHLPRTPSLTPVPSLPLFTQPLPEFHFLFHYVRDCGCIGDLDLSVRALSSKQARLRASGQFRAWYRANRSICEKCKP